MINTPKSLQIPYQDALSDAQGALTRPWEMFFRTLKEIVDPMGFPRFATLQNNKTNEPIAGIRFDATKESCVFLDFIVQRATSAPAAGVDAGTLIFAYSPTNDQWLLRSSVLPGAPAAGVTFSVSTGGELRYTSADWAGNQLAFRLTFRMRTLAGGKKG